MPRSSALFPLVLSAIQVGCTVAEPPVVLLATGGAANVRTDAGPGNGGAIPGAGGSNAGGSGPGGAPSNGGAMGGGGAMGSGGNPPSGNWVNATSNLAGLASECGNVSGVSAKPGENFVITGVAQKGLFATTDAGGSWQPLGTGAGSDTITNRITSIIYDPDDTNRFWESGIYNGGGVYRTEDKGVTWKQLGDDTHCDLVAVDFTDAQRMTLLAGFHETPQKLFKSVDGGQTWADVGAGLPGATACTTPLIVDSQTFLVGCSGYGGGPTGIYQSTDGGQTWNSLTASGGGSAPLRASDGSIYWASANNSGMTRSTDNGQSWNDVVGPNIIRSTAPVELPDGRIATLSGGGIVVSSDHGATWTSVSSSLPYNDAQGLAYSAGAKAFFVWHFTCGFSGPVPVPDDAIMRFDFDYQTN